MNQITDVNTDIIPYIKAKYFKRAIAIVVVLVVIEAAWLWASFYKGIYTDAVFEIAAIPVVVAYFLWSIVKDGVEEAFMEQFAAANNFLLATLSIARADARIPDPV